jgi:prepilin-type N-terminal cleavage/methylation domain-containing protein
MTRPAESGFTLVEVLVASAVGLLVTLTAAMLVMEAQGSWRADSARVDLQQRARVAADVLTRALREAGLNPHDAARSGPLIRSVAPILPRRTGARGADPPHVVRRDAVTVLSAVPEAQQAVLLLDLPAGGTVFEIAPGPLCTMPHCGLAPNVHVMLADGAGQHDVFTVLTVMGTVIGVRHHGSGATASYPAGSRVIPVASTTYAVDGPTRTLRAYNGDTSDLPLVDDVLEMTVEYFGEARPPTAPRPLEGQANCLYASDGSYQSGSMPVLDAPGGLALLTTDLLADGPWCGAGPRQFDADLLRIRRLRVTLRLQASDPAVRGSDPARFRVPGAARRPGGMVPDATVVVDVSPQNLLAPW